MIHAALGALLAAVLGAAAAYVYGLEAGEDRCLAQLARDEQVRRETREAALQGAADAIAAIEIKHVTVQQAVEREVRTRAVYSDCRHAKGTFKELNSLLAGDASLAAPGLSQGLDR